jgi:hypothetical protein
MRNYILLALGLLGMGCGGKTLLHEPYNGGYTSVVMTDNKIRTVINFHDSSKVLNEDLRPLEARVEDINGDDIEDLVIKSNGKEYCFTSNPDGSYSFN